MDNFVKENVLADKFSKDAKVKLTLFQKIGQKTFRRLRHRQFCEKRMKNLGYETMLDERKIVVRMYKLARRAFAKFRWKRLLGARGSKEGRRTERWMQCGNIPCCLQRRRKIRSWQS